MKIAIPADYFYKGSPEEEYDVTEESIDRGIENARKVFGADFMLGETSKEKKRPN